MSSSFLPGSCVPFGILRYSAILPQRFRWITSVSPPKLYKQLCSLNRVYGTKCAMIGDFGLKKQGSSMLASFLLQIWTIRLGLGCVNSTSWLLQAKGREVTHSKTPLCT